MRRQTARGKRGIRIVTLALCVLCISAVSAIGQTVDLTGLAKDTRVVAADQPGKDPCDKIKAAIGRLPSVGGLVDATGFTPAYLSSNPCTTTVAVNVPAHIIFGIGTWKLHQPGCAITIAASHVVLEGVSWATEFVSGGNNIAQVCETSDLYHQYVVKNLYMKGNKIAYFGTFFTGQGYGAHTEDVQAGGFRGAALFQPVHGMSLLGPIVLTGNHGEGMVVGADGDISGYVFVEGNKGNGIHVVSGGTKINQVDSDHNYLSGIYLDGRTPPAWTGDTLYTTAFILPVHNNPGSYVYYGIYSGRTGGSEPAWPQSVGSMVPDGGITWVCVAPNSSIGSLLGQVAFTSIFGGFIDDNGDSGPAAVEADNIRIEATNTNNAPNIRIVGSILSQAQKPFNGGSIVDTVMGLHAINASLLTVSDVQWHGGASAQPLIKDSGGIVIDGGYSNTISSFSSIFGAKNPIRIGAHAINTMINGVNNLDNGYKGVSLIDSYCVYLDSTTARSQLSNIHCDNATNSWHGRGVGNASNDNANSLIGYQNFSPQPGPDSLGNFKRQ